jgi:RimJ/RimL family protein N-acetyltransferase
MTAPPLRISTPRLELVAATPITARADASDRPRLAALLEATIPETWPPSTMLDVQEYFAAQLEQGAAVPGWWNWYAVERASRTLIGAGGFNGQPNDEGFVTMGYSVVEGFEGRGYATELAGGLMDWAAETGRVKRAIATTFERHFASIRVLEKNGFVCRGISSEDAAASEEDRQGRGALMVYMREFA